jgi:cell division protein ZapB
MVGVCASLRNENQDLRVRVASLEAEKAALAKKIEVTAGRLETLLERLPEE